MSSPSCVRGSTPLGPEDVEKWFDPDGRLVKEAAMRKALFEGKYMCLHVLGRGGGGQVCQNKLEVRSLGKGAWLVNCLVKYWNQFNSQSKLCVESLMLISSSMYLHSSVSPYQSNVCCTATSFESVKSNRLYQNKLMSLLFVPLATFQPHFMHELGH